MANLKAECQELLSHQLALITDVQERSPELYNILERDFKELYAKIERLPELFDFFSRHKTAHDSSAGYFAALPEHIIKKIFMNLDESSLLRCGGVCSLFRQLSSSAELWKHVFSPQLLTDANKAGFAHLRDAMLSLKMRIPSSALPTYTGYGWHIESKGKYCGHFVNGRPHGCGILNTDVYDYYGQFVDGVREGFGRTLWKEGKVHEGTYRKDKRNGFGVFQWENGHEYKGNFEDDKRNGEGTFKFSDGSEWKGTFRNNERYYGTYTWPNNSRKYDGFWNRSARHGQGRYWWPDGVMYDGNWVDDRRDGDGVLRFADGDHYSGTWRASCRVRGEFFQRGYVFFQEWEESVFDRENKGLPLGLDLSELVVGQVVQGAHCKSTLTMKPIRRVVRNDVNVNNNSQQPHTNTSGDLDIGDSVQ